MRFYMRFLSFKSHFSNYYSTLDILFWFSQITVQNWIQDDENKWEVVYLKIKNQKISWKTENKNWVFIILYSDSQQ